MLKKLLFFSFLLSVLHLNGQIRKISEQGSGLIHLEKQQLSFDLLSPGISFEIGLFRNQSVSSSLGLGMATYQEGYALGLAWNNRYRYYHNLNRRSRMGKNVAGNSGNYIAAAQAIFFSQLRIATNIEGPKDFNIGFYGIGYGLQRTYPKGLNFNVELAGGYYRGDGVFSGYGPLLTLKIGWTPKKRKAKKPVFNQE